MKSDVRTTRCTAMATGAALALFLFAAAAPAGASAEPITISVLSGRADLVSGGDALVRIGGVSSTKGLKVTVGGANRTKRLRQARRRHGRRARARAQARTQRDHRPSRRSRRAVDGHQPPEGRPDLLRPAAAAVEVPGDREGRAVQRAGRSSPTSTSRPTRASPASSPTTRPTRLRTSRRPRPTTAVTRAVHRAHRDRLPRPRPVPDRRALPARQAVERPWRRSRSSTTSC